MLGAIETGIADGISVKIMQTGGLTRAQTVARMAATTGISAFGSDMCEAGLAHLAGAHMTAVKEEVSLACEYYQANYFLVEDLLQSMFETRNRNVIVPQTAGLGNQPDLGKVEHYVIFRSAVLGAA